MKRVVASSLLLAALSPALLAAPAAAQFEAAEHDASTSWWQSEPAPGPAPTVPVPVPTVPPPTLPTGSNRLVYIDREPEWKLGKCEGDCDKDEVREAVRHISASASASFCSVGLECKGLIYVRIDQMEGETEAGGWLSCAWTERRNETSRQLFIIFHSIL